MVCPKNEPLKAPRAGPPPTGCLREGELVGAQAAGLRGRQTERVLSDAVAVLVVVHRRLPFLQE
jgi:hypothetical protein